MSIRVLIGLVLVSAGVAPGQADQKVSKAQAKRWVQNAFFGKEKVAAEDRARLMRCRPEDRKVVFAALESLKIKPSLKRVKGKRLELEAEAPEAKRKKVPLVIRLPRGYSGKKPVPVLFRFHGSGDTAAAFDRTNESSVFSQFLTVTPEIPSDDRMGWNQPGTFDMIDRIYRRLVREFNVDTDRVYLSGYSAGGGAACFVAEMWPHRFAGFFSMGRLHHAYHPNPKACMNVLRHVPGFFAVGLDDQKDRVDGYREAEAYYKEEGLPGEFRFTKRVGHSYQQNLDKPALKYLAKKSRNAYPRSFDAIFYSYQNRDKETLLRSRQYWLEAKRPAPNGTVCRVTVEGNTIKIDAKELRTGAVLLNDHIVDLDQPVTVLLNGRKVHDGPVERSLEFLFGWFSENRDRRELFWNRIRF
ncbi:MAG: hypothetical protein CMJ83_19255 [Planctomycetes bacterium]|nr:hypothetical protein [Planctomycetota bacterium]